MSLPPNTSKPKHAWAVATRKRTPVDWRRYSAHAARARRRLPRYEHPLVVSAALSIVLAVLGVALLQVVGGGLAAGVAQIGSSFTSALATPKPTALVVGEAPVTVSAAPVLADLPEFTRSNAVTLSGKIPSFAITPERRVRLEVNSTVVATLPIRADGAFGPLAVTLPDGPSTVTARLMEGDTEIAAASDSVVVDRTPPALSITKPAAGSDVTGPDVLVEGKVEPGASLTINGGSVPPNPDGTFSSRITAPEGPLMLTVIARDQAGNETKQELKVQVKAGSATPAPALALGISLDRTTVRPGETVLATVVATQGGKPKADLAVTLQVGVTTLGTYRTDASGVARIPFAAPDHEATDVAVVAIGGGATARASLTTALPTPRPTSP